MIPVHLYNAQKLRCSTTKSLINHPLAVCEAELVKSFKERDFREIVLIGAISSFELAGGSWHEGHYKEITGQVGFASWDLLSHHLEWLGRAISLGCISSLIWGVFHTTEISSPSHAKGSFCLLTPLSVVSQEEIKLWQRLWSPQGQVQGLSLLIGLNPTSYRGSLRPEQIENKEDNTDRWLTCVYSCREFSDFIKFSAQVWAQSNLRCGWFTTGFHLWMEIGLWKLDPGSQWSWAHSSREVELIFSFERSS